MLLSAGTSACVTHLPCWKDHQFWSAAYVKDAGRSMGCFGYVPTRFLNLQSPLADQLKFVLVFSAELFYHKGI